MISLTKALALEFGRYNIRANIVCPGTVRTPLWNERASRNPHAVRRGRIIQSVWQQDATGRAEATTADANNLPRQETPISAPPNQPQR